MNGTDGKTGDSFLSRWVEGERQNLLLTGILWLAAATIYWFGVESLGETGDLAVGAVFMALALYYFGMAVFADQTRLEKQGGSCRWSWGW